MYIGDWSSDVCSSDLADRARQHADSAVRRNRKGRRGEAGRDPHLHLPFQRPPRMPESRRHHRSEERRVGKESSTRLDERQEKEKPKTQTKKQGSPRRT